MTRGIYTRIVLVAYDWKDGKLVQRWIFDSDVPGMGKDGKFNIAYAGQGNHSLTVADVTTTARTRSSTALLHRP